MELRSGLLVELGWDIDLARVRLGYDMVRIRVRYERRVIGTAGVIAPFIRRNGSCIKAKE